MDTIFALSSAPGKAGVAVVRVSGPAASASFAAFAVAMPKPRSAKLATLRLADGSALDRGLVLFFPAPHSFTGEDIAEYHVHGGRAVIRRLLADLALLSGLRAAEPGEFSRRAFLNGKMDLTEAEGLADLIDAETEAQRRQAYRIMQGEAGVFYRALREDILSALALYEAYIDFPEEDIPEQVLRQTAATARRISSVIVSQLEGSAAIERIRDGIRIAIIGPPNAGKSSLLNRLSRRDAAIVSEFAGTTRDVIEVHMDIGGYAVVLADTAGIREAQDAIEEEGIRRSLTRAETADIRILMLDATNVGDHDDEAFAGFLKADDIVLFNKCDIAQQDSFSYQGHTPIAFSARTEIGMERLLELLSARMAEQAICEDIFVTHERHRKHLREALFHLRRFELIDHHVLELKCEELRRAAVEIGMITGAIAVDEILSVIFSHFCIGK